MLSVLLSLFANNPQGQTISSLSWAGYTVSRSTNATIEVTAISASWTVPTMNASVTDGYSSTWIGIGGQVDKTLIQVGTEQDVTNGQTSYSAWYETLPGFAITLDSINISPGDAMVASISLISSATNLWSIQISDASTGQTFSTNVVYNSTRSSGEWIIERPTINHKLSTLADFGSATFTDCHVRVDSQAGPIGIFSYSRIDMTNSQNTQLVSVSPLATDKASFTVNYITGQ